MMSGREHEVEHFEHGGEPVGQLVIFGHPVGDLGGGDLLLRPADPLTHRRVLHEERSGDLRSCHATQRSERKRDLGLL